MSNYFILQLRREYGVIIDSDAFLGAFFMDNRGQRIKVGPWRLGPGHRLQQPSDQSTTLPTNYYKLIDQEGIWVSMYDKWGKYYHHAAGHIPYAVCKANGASPLGMDNFQVEESASGTDDENEEFDGIDDGESIEGHITKRPGGRPLNGNGDHSGDKL